MPRECACMQCIAVQTLRFRHGVLFFSTFLDELNMDNQVYKVFGKYFNSNQSLNRKKKTFTRYKRAGRICYDLLPVDAQTLYPMIPIIPIALPSHHTQFSFADNANTEVLSQDTAKTISTYTQG